MLSLVQTDYIVISILGAVAFVISIFLSNILRGYILDYCGYQSENIAQLKSLNIIDHINLISLFLYIAVGIWILPAVPKDEKLIQGNFKKIFILFLYFVDFFISLFLSIIILVISMLIFGIAMQNVVFSLFGIHLLSENVSVVQEISLMLSGRSSFAVLVAMLLASIVKFNIVISIFRFLYDSLKYISYLMESYKFFKMQYYIDIFTIVGPLILIMSPLGNYIFAFFVGNIFKIALFIFSLIK